MKYRIIKYIELWVNRCYVDGIPDEAPTELEKNGLVPSYRRICKAIMKNDSQLQELGYNRKKCKLYMDLKRDELTIKGKIKPDNQLKIF